MICDICHNQLKERRATKRDPYHYTESGLSDVYLIGVTILVCQHCKEESAIIPKVGQLHKLIAKCLLDKPDLLRGDELRFLRKFAGIQAQTLADWMQMVPEHLSRIENGHTKGFGATSDAFARALLREKIIRPIREALTAYAEKLAKQKQKAAQTPVYTLERNAWKAAA